MLVGWGGGHIHDDEVVLGALVQVDGGQPALVLGQLQKQRARHAIGGGEPATAARRLATPARSVGGDAVGGGFRGGVAAHARQQGALLEVASK